MTPRRVLKGQQWVSNRPIYDQVPWWDNEAGNSVHPPPGEVELGYASGTLL